MHVSRSQHACPVGVVAACVIALLALTSSSRVLASPALDSSLSIEARLRALGPSVVAPLRRHLAGEAGPTDPADPAAPTSEVERARAAWQAVVAALEAGDDARGLALQAILTERGSWLALGDPACLLTQDLWLLDRFSRAERQVGGVTLEGHLPSMDTPMQALPAREARGDDPMVDQLARLAAAYRADTPPRDPGIAASVCGLEVADTLASLLLAPAGDWLDRPRPLVGGPTPPPSDVLARIAMHRYLATDWRTLAALMEEAEAASWDAADREALQVLAHVAARRTEGWSRSVDALEASQVSWHLLAAAELRRVRGDLEGARRRVDAVVDAEPFSAIAWIVRSAVRVAQGEASEVHRDLAFLRHGWGGTRAYGYWIDALARALR